VHSAATLIELTERALLGAKDDAAEQAIREAAQRTAMVTALSPRASLDLVFVLVQSLALIRQVAALYGVRAQGLALFKLAPKIGMHLALTGGVAVGESLLGQIVGAGFAAKLSAKLGEGMLNGILTARVGLAALEHLRPMRYRAREGLTLSEVVKNIVTLSKAAEKPAAFS
jgi:putative membrane protein